MVASRISHGSLYAAMLAMPLAGLAGSMFSTSGAVFFGVTIPRIVAPDKSISELLYSAHSAIAWILVALIALHVLAALKHLFVNKDQVFQRMWS